MKKKKNKQNERVNWALDPHKEVVDMIERAEGICGLSLLQDSKITELVEARSVIYYILNKEKRVITQSISDSLVKLGFIRMRSAITHSILNFESYYNSSEFARKLYADLTDREIVEEVEKPKRELTDLEYYLTTIPLDMHNRLIDTVKLKVSSFDWKSRDNVKSYEMEI